MYFYKKGGNNGGNYAYKNVHTLKLKEWTKFEVYQSLEKDRDIYIIRLKVNGKLVAEMDVPEAADLEDVHVFAGDPWYCSPEGLIKDLFVSAPTSARGG